MFRVFDRYLLKEVINGWLAVTLFLWLILVSNRLVGYLGEAVSGDIPAKLIFKLIGLKMVWYLVHVMPFALALGVVIGLGFYLLSQVIGQVGQVLEFNPLLTTLVPGAVFMLFGIRAVRRL